MKLKNECEGCKSYNDIESKGACLACNIPRLSNSIKCPCIICLVKGMCVRVCEEFKIYVDKVYEYHGVEGCKDIKERKRYEINRSV